MNLRRLITLPATRVRAVREAVEWSTGPARRMRYHDVLPQKGTAEVVAENAMWALRYGEVNDGYFLLGLDAVGAKASAFHRKKRNSRVIASQISAREAWNLYHLLKDKYLFGLVAQALGYPSPRNLALLTSASATLLSPRRRFEYSRLVEDGYGLRGFCKPVAAQGGQGAFLLDVSGGEIRVDGKSTSPEDLRTLIDTRYVVQEQIEQHQDMAALHPSSLNTLRLITVQEGEGTRLFSAFFRVGTRGSIADNWSSGGLIVHIDRPSGRLVGPGLYKLGKAPESSGVTVNAHPDTAIEFDGFEIPAFEEAVGLVERFHDDLGPLVQIAWDVALTPDGPVVVEGNTHPDARGMMALDPTYLDRYRALVARTLPG